MATPEVTREAVQSFDLAIDTVRSLNEALHLDGAPGRVVVRNPGGRHAIAVGLDAPYEVEIEGHVGYYCAGMNKLATVRIRGNCGVGVAENMMSGMVLVEGSASQSAGATARGGLLVIQGDASARCGISLKGADIVVRGSVGGLGADCVEKQMRAEHLSQVAGLLASAGFDDVDPSEFRRYGSARRLYNFHVDNLGAY